MNSPSFIYSPNPAVSLLSKFRSIRTSPSLIAYSSASSPPPIKSSGFAAPVPVSLTSSLPAASVTVDSVLGASVSVSLAAASVDASEAA